MLVYKRRQTSCKTESRHIFMVNKTLIQVFLGLLGRLPARCPEVHGFKSFYEFIIIFSSNIDCVVGSNSQILFLPNTRPRVRSPPLKGFEHSFDLLVRQC